MPTISQMPIIAPPLIESTTILDTVSSEKAKIETITKVQTFSGSAIDSGNLWKGVAKLSTSENIVLSGLQTIDSVSVSSGDSILVKNQTNGIDNGLYIASRGNWVRNVNLLTGANAIGMSVFVTEGIESNTIWVCVSNPAIVGTDILTFQKANDPSSQNFLYSIISNNTYIYFVAVVYSGGTPAIELVAPTYPYYDSGVIENGITVPVNGRFQVSENGIYQVNYNVKVFYIDSFICEATLMVNGTDIKAQTTYNIIMNNIVTTISDTFVIKLNANDYISLFFRAPFRDYILVVDPQPTNFNIVKIASL